MAKSDRTHDFKIFGLMALNKAVFSALVISATCELSLKLAASDKRSWAWEREEGLLGVLPLNEPVFIAPKISATCSVSACVRYNSQGMYVCVELRGTRKCKCPTIVYGVRVSFPSPLLAPLAVFWPTSSSVVSVPRMGMSSSRKEEERRARGPHVSK